MDKRQIAASQDSLWFVAFFPVVEIHVAVEASSIVRELRSNEGGAKYEASIGHLRGAINKEQAKHND